WFAAPSMARMGASTNCRFHSAGSLLTRATGPNDTLGSKVYGGGARDSRPALGKGDGMATSREALERFFGAWTDGRVDVLDEILAEDAVIHYGDTPDLGREGLKQL